MRRFERIREPQNNSEKSIRLSSQASGNIVLKGADLIPSGRLILSENVYNGVPIPDTNISFTQRSNNEFSIVGKGTSKTSLFEFSGTSAHWFLEPYNFQIQTENFYSSFGNPCNE